MIKTVNRTLTMATIGSLCLLSPALLHAATPSKGEIDQLKQQVQQLMLQNQQLNQRLTEMEKSVQAQPAVEEEKVRHKSIIEQEVARQVKEKGSGPGINEFVSLSGSIEGDYKLGKDFQGDHSSEFVLDTVELIFDLKVTDWATGKIVVDYDGDDEDRFYLDEANITLGKTETVPFFLTGGKIYAPFGDFSTNMIQDPLTQTLGEINPKGVIAGFEKSGFTATVFSYNGMGENSDPADDDNDTINGFGASLAYRYEQEDRGFKVGGSWVNNIPDSATITDYLEDGGVSSISDQVPGIALFFGGNYKGFSLQTEYVTALDSFDVNEIAYGFGEAAVGAEPAAWNSELAYTTSIADKETVFAIGYQKSWESVALELPENRYIASAAIVIFAGTTLAFEYFHDEDYSLTDGGTDNNGHGFTTRLAYEF
jgi:hypothetical protein